MWEKRRKKLSNRPRGRVKRRQSGAPLMLIMFVLCILATLGVSFLYYYSRTYTTKESQPFPHLRSTKMATKSQEEAHHDKDSSNIDAWPLLHIVNTRFMQEQGHLVHLARARLKLFETFCLPTMQHQTSRRFLWIIKTDPKLDIEIRNNLVTLLQPHDNFFLVASNQNYGIQAEGSWRDAREGTDVLSSRIYTGNVTTLQRAHDLRSAKPILETRLDADDGIHKLYLQYIQYSAMKFLVQDEKRWLYWCSRRHLEWYVSVSKKEGMVNPVQHEKLCITPGITVGYNVGVDQVPQYDHDVLYKEIEAHGGCHHLESNNQEKNNMDCIQLVDDLSFVAVRSRTPTSAGMKDISLQKEILDTERVKMVWKALDKLFFVSKQQAVETNAYVLEHLTAIAKDNLEGQCTSGHSCKNSSFVILQSLVENGTV